MKRRLFLQSIGALLGGSAVSACTGAREEKLAAYLVPPRETVPGIAAYFATVCRACPAGCGILVKTRENRPIKLEGNPEHPVNRGGLCPRGQAFIQSLYGSERVRTPLVRDGKHLRKASWEQAMTRLAGPLGSNRPALMLSALEGGSYDEMVGELTGRFTGFVHCYFEPLSHRSLAAASETLYGKQETPFVSLESVDYLVSLGADLLDAWMSPVQHARQWAEGHGLDKGNKRRLQMVYLGPRRNLTANAADRWYRTGPAEMGAIAHAILDALFSKRRADLSPGDAAVIEALLRRTKTEPGPHEAVARQIAGKLAAAKHPVVLWGGSEVIGADCSTVATLVLAVNHMIGAVGDSIGYGQGYAYSACASDREVHQLLDQAAEGKFGALILHNTNPVYTLPGAFGAADKIGRAPLVAALAWEHNETTRLADVVLPIHHPLESWGDYQVTNSIAGLMQPVRAPLYDTRHPGDVILELARRAGRPMKHDDFKAYVTGRWSRPDTALGSGNNAQFDQALISGGRFGHQNTENKPAFASEAARAVARIPELVASPSDAVSLIVPCSGAFHDGRDSVRPWLREMPDPLLQTAWEVPVEVSGDLARAAKIEDGTEVELASQHGKLKGRAVVSADLAPRTVALRMGGGRELGPGEQHGNAMRLLGTTTDRASGQLVLSGTAVSLKALGPGRLARVMGSPYSEGRYLHLSIKYQDVRAGRYPKMSVHGEVYPDQHPDGPFTPMPHEEDPREGTRAPGNIFTLFRHREHRWGMVVDLDRCTGCGACVAACYAENNIPTVGRDEILRGRELSWLRIEKHITGRGGEQSTGFLPVMCQHCDQAPCETVCPVFAPHHTGDGLNAQIYNRCVGTRYCANNCPYKVRRFNYFDYPRETPANQQLNPDVTVRSRGVMEKCTMCIQRIREVTNRARADGRKVGDGEITPACAQTCPTGALTFGDFKNRNAAMTRLARDGRAYRLLDYMVNTRPGVVYLRRVLSSPEDLKS